MNVGELKEALDGFDEDMEVQVRISPGTDGDYDKDLDEWFGEYCEVTDDRSVLVEYGKLTIVADYYEGDE